jgi:hypothetical protein
MAGISHIFDGLKWLCVKTLQGSRRSPVAESINFRN